MVSDTPAIKKKQKNATGSALAMALQQFNKPQGDKYNVFILGNTRYALTYPLVIQHMGKG